MTRFAAIILLTASLAGACFSPATAQPSTYQVGNTTLHVSTVATGLNVVWELAWGPDNYLWMTERLGRISRMNPATGQQEVLLTVPDVTATGEGGLLGMVLQPAPAPGGGLFVYVVYNYTDAGTLKEKLVRYTYQNGALASPQVLLSNLAAAQIHNGSRLLLLPDNTLLMTTGDAANTSLPQNAQSLSGKILRLNLDGSVPANNPTAGSLIYSLGHRNPQGLARSSSGRIYSSEHGPSNDDEVNLIEPGRNYGWPNVEGFCNSPAEQAFCQANNVVEPLRAWTPTLAVSGLVYYDHPAIPEWRNSLLLVTLKTGRVMSLPLSADGGQIQGENILWSGNYGRHRAICVSPQGKVYVATSNRDGGGPAGPTDDRILLLENRAFSPNSARTLSRSHWAVYPSPTPAGAPATVKIPAHAAAAQAAVTDTQGRVVWQRTVGTGQQELQLPPMAPGLYLLQLTSPTGSTTYGKLLRQ